MLFKVIIVDDEQYIKIGMRKLVDWYAHGFEISFELSNGKEALAALRENVCHLLFTDIKMPEMDGIELMRMAKRMYPDLFVVVLSGYSDFEYAKNAIKYGAKDYMLKPVGEQELSELLCYIHEELQKLTEKAYDTQDDLSPEALEIKYIKEVVDYVKIYYSDNLTLKDIAARLYINPIYLGQLFARATGMSFHQYLTNVRIFNAKRMLAYTSIPVYEISSKVGFRTTDYFVAKFKELTDMTPTQYRGSGI